MPNFSCLGAFLTLVPILQAKYYHQSTISISVLAVLQCQAAFVGWNLFVPYKTKIYNNSRSVTTYSSSPFSCRTIYTIAISVTLKWSDLTSQWYRGFSLNPYPACWPPASSLRACTYMCAHAVYVCWCCSSASHHRACCRRCRGLYLCCLTQDKGCNCSNIHILHPVQTHAEGITHEPSSSVSFPQEGQ